MGRRNGRRGRGKCICALVLLFFFLLGNKKMGIRKLSFLRHRKEIGDILCESMNRKVSFLMVSSYWEEGDGCFETSFFFVSFFYHASRKTIEFRLKRCIFDIFTFLSVRRTIFLEIIFLLVLSRQTN